MQAEIAQGSRENVASAKVRIEARIAETFAGAAEDDRNKIRDAACGNKTATRKVRKHGL